MGGPSDAGASCTPWTPSPPPGNPQRCLPLHHPLSSCPIPLHSVAASAGWPVHTVHRAHGVQADTVHRSCARVVHVAIARTTCAVAPPLLCTQGPTKFPLTRASAMHSTRMGKFRAVAWPMWLLAHFGGAPVATKRASWAGAAPLPLSYLCYCWHTSGVFRATFWVGRPLAWGGGGPNPGMPFS